jgi:2'-5' RNA ligase
VKRTFLAVKVDAGPELLQLAGILKKELTGEGINWVVPENYHVTLRFLGDTPDQMIRSVSGMIRQIPGIFGKSSGMITGLGTFKQNRIPSVLYTHLKGLPMLDEIAGFVENRIQGLGFQAETRGFKPHLTLGRIRNLKDVRHFSQVVEKLSPIFNQEVTVEKIIFYESILTPSGPEYKSLETVFLPSLR